MLKHLMAISDMLEGEFVEPIQLQVVCRRWWKERKEYKGSLNKKDKLKIYQMLTQLYKTFMKKPFMMH